jgi:isoquinoline 1-oxidoreductase
MDRRDFFKLAGGGIVLLATAAPSALLAQGAPQLPPRDFNAYLVVGADGRVTVFSGKVEMGQGVMTSLAQMAAEELGVPLASVDMVLGDTARCPWDMGTFGSLTTRMFGPLLRAAAAQARSVLLDMAARRLGVPVERLAARDGNIWVADAPERSVSYAQLSQGARLVQVVDGQAVLRASAQFRVMGVPTPRLDAREKVIGAAKYTADLRQPDLLYACVLRAPMHGARLAGLDTRAARALAGAVVVERDTLVAALHADPVTAQAALRKVQAQWQLPPQALNPDNIFDHLQASAPPAKDVLLRGNAPPTGAQGLKHFEASYQKGYVAHAPMEPHAALAVVKDGQATVWASTQTPFPLRDRLAQVLGLANDRVRVITPYVGGGFGGKSAGGQAVEAALLAQATGRPVQVAWSRTEEFFNDSFDPACVVNIASSMDGNGQVISWDAQVFAAGERGATPVYDFAHTRVRSAGRALYEAGAAPEQMHPFAVGPWRAPGANMNVFATESHMDAMAHAAGASPLAFRLRHLSDPRMRRVLTEAAAAFGWQDGARPPGTGWGMACGSDAGSCVATMAEVSVDARNGTVKVLRMVCAQDMGVVVNPSGARMQIEGGLTMGLGYALSEELNFSGGEVLDRNFGTYAIPRFSQVPRIQTVLVRNDDLAPQGAGEPAITTVGAALANAVFAACGARLRRLPMTPQRVLAALRSPAR